MTLGSWDPQAASAAASTTIEAATLDRLIGYSQDDRLDQLEDLLQGTESQQMAGLMQIDHDQWHSAADALDNDAIRHLIRFFAVAENLPGWEAGEKSPAIPLARVLRNRGERLDKAFLRWLRQVSENRYLPYGPL